MRKMISKWISVLLVAAMVFTMMPSSITFAEELDDSMIETTELQDASETETAEAETIEAEVVEAEVVEAEAAEAEIEEEDISIEETTEESQDEETDLSLGEEKEVAVNFDVIEGDHYTLAIDAKMIGGYGNGISLSAILEDLSVNSYSYYEFAGWYETDPNGGKHKYYPGANVIVPWTDLKTSGYHTFTGYIYHGTEEEGEYLDAGMVSILVTDTIGIIGGKQIGITGEEKTVELKVCAVSKVSETLTYQWYEVTPSGALVDIDGATSNSYAAIVANIQSAESKFVCRISDGISTLDYEIEVHQPGLRYHDTDFYQYTVAPNSNRLLKSNITSTITCIPVTYTWYVTQTPNEEEDVWKYFDLDELQNGQSYDFQEIAQSNKSSIYGMAEPNAAKTCYACVAQQGDEEPVVVRFELISDEFAVIMDEEAYTEKFKTKTLKADTSYEDSSACSYQWSVLNPATGQNVTLAGETKSTYTTKISDYTNYISPSQGSCLGTVLYICTIKTPTGSIKSGSTTLFIYNVDPIELRLFSSAGGRRLFKGANVRIGALVLSNEGEQVSDEDLTYQWEWKKPDGQFEIVENNNSRSLAAKNLPAGNNTFRCRVSDSNCTVSSDCTVQVIDSETAVTAGLNEEAEVPLYSYDTGRYSYFKFTPETSGVYKIVAYHDEDDDPQIIGLDETGMETDWFRTDDAGVKMLVDYFEAGKTYYFAAINEDKAEDTSKVWFYVTRGFTNDICLVEKNYQKILLDKEGLLEVKTAGAASDYTYRWYCETEYQTFTLINGANESTLKVNGYDYAKTWDSPTSRPEYQTFQCVVSDGRNEATATFDVTFVSVITKNKPVEKDIFVENGSIYTMYSDEIEHILPVTYQWYLADPVAFDYDPIEGMTSPVYTGTIDFTNSAPIRRYLCIASDGVSEAWTIYNFYEAIDDVPSGEKKSIEDVTMPSLPEVTYTGSQIRPAVKIDGLKENVDYKVEYGENISPYEPASATIIGMGNYEGSKTIYFAINLGSNPVPTLSNVKLGVNVSWEAVPGAKNYLVYRKDTDYGTDWKLIQKVEGANSYLDTNEDLSKGFEYEYKILFGDENGELLPELYDYLNYDVKTSSIWVLGYLGVNLSNVSGGVKLTWVSMYGSEGYYIYRKTGSGKFTKIKTVPGEDLEDFYDITFTYTDKTAVSGTAYTYAVKPYYGSYTGTYQSKSIYYLATPTPSVTNAASGVSVKWSKVAGAVEYYIYRKTENGSYSKIKTVKASATLAYTDTEVSSNNGTTYYYTVKARNGSYVSAGKSVKILRLTRPTISSLTNVAPNKAVLKWNKNSKAYGYQVQMSTSSSFTSASTYDVYPCSIVTKTIGSRTKGKTYYFRVRSYKGLGGVNYFSAWSDYKYVKITK